MVEQLEVVKVERYCKRADEGWMGEIATEIGMQTVMKIGIGW